MEFIFNFKKNQLLILVTFSLVMYCLNMDVMSFFLGGVCSTIPAMVFHKFALKQSTSHQVIVKNFYIGEVLKWFISVILFIFTFNLFKVSPGIFFFSYVVLTLSQWFFSTFITNNT